MERFRQLPALFFGFEDSHADLGVQFVLLILFQIGEGFPILPHREVVAHGDERVVE